MTWIFSTPNTQITTTPLEAKNSISPTVTYIGAGAVVKKDGDSGTTLTVAIPTAASGTVLVMCICMSMQDSSSSQVTTPAGWTLVSFDVETTYSNSGMYIYTKTHNGSDTNVVVTHTTQGYSNRVLFGNCSAWNYTNTTTPVSQNGTRAIVQTGSNNSSFPSTYSTNYNLTVGTNKAVIIFGIANHATLPLVTATPPVTQGGLSYFEIADSNNDNTLWGDNSWFGINAAVNASGASITMTNPTTVQWSSTFAAKNGIIKCIELQPTA